MNEGMNQLRRTKVRLIAEEAAQNITPEMTDDEVFAYLSSKTSHVDIIDEVMRILDNKRYEAEMEERYEGEEEDGTGFSGS